MNLRVVIVDDEALARRGIRARLRAFPNMTVVQECSDGKSAIRAIRQHEPDLIFLDVQMPGMGGFEILASIAGQSLPSVIFVTAFDQHAVRAFEVHALDYLLKPIDDDRFVEAVKRAQTIIRQEKMGDVAQRLNALLAERSGSNRPAEVTRYTERLAVREGSRIRFVLANEIEWVEAAGDYVIVHTAKQTHLLRETLTALEKRLDPNRFLRIHRSTIVKTSRIVELDALPNREYLVRMADGKQLRSSRTYQDRLAHWLP